MPEVSMAWHVGDVTPVPKRSREAEAKAAETKKELAAARRAITNLNNKVRRLQGGKGVDIEQERVNAAVTKEIDAKTSSHRQADAVTKVQEVAAAALLMQREKATEVAKLKAVEHVAKVKRLNERIAALGRSEEKLGKQLTFAMERLTATRETLKHSKVTVRSAAVAREVVEKQLKEVNKLKTMLDVDIGELSSERDELHDLEDQLRQELESANAGPDGRTSEAKASIHLEALKRQMGIKSKSQSVPRRDVDTDGDKWWQSDPAKLSVRHMVACLEGRGEGKCINLVAEALHRCRSPDGSTYLEALVDTRRFQPVIKGLVGDAVAKIQEHWTARHAVHIWDRLELSRRQMEKLHHLLSYIYDPVTDSYAQIRVWENPFDKKDYVLTARLASREKREAEYRDIAEEMDIVVGANGRCERDAVQLTQLLYTNYAGALREVYTMQRPAQPILFLDGTGGALGRGICHGEMGCADFKKSGDTDAKQSRSTLQPLFLYEGNDHAVPLRENLDLSIKTYNKLVDTGCFDRVTLKGETVSTPCRPMTVADMQGAKTTYGMRECSHSVWCKCQRGDGGPHCQFPTQRVETYEEMCAYCEDEVGCKMKTHEEMCSWAHFSPGVARGGSFTPFTCSCCGYSPTEQQWRADLTAHHLQTDEEQDAASRVHMDSNDEMNSNFKHYHQELFMPPLPHHDMWRCGVDGLHLLYLNHFKHLFKYTIHEGLPESKKVIVRDYLKAAGFYSYDAASPDEDPVKHWIGREVKRFLDHAHIHLPFLLHVAASPADCSPEMEEHANADGEQQMEYDEEYTPSPEDIEAEEEEEPLMMQNAQRWDNFLDLVRDTQLEWPQDENDTDEYRKGRAVSAFNLGSVCANDLLQLKPTMLTWVPHILVFIVPRQLFLLGDSTRRSADACESFGAMVKKLIKHHTCRRRISTKGEDGSWAPTSHVKVETTKERSARRWTQTFTVGYIQQAFTRSTVRESLRHGTANAPYKLREDYLQTSIGLASKTSKRKVEGPMRSIKSASEYYTPGEQSGGGQ